MARLTLADFRRQFESVLDPADRIVVVYSGIWTFGHRFGLDLNTLPAALIETMLEAVGPNRTLLLQTKRPRYDAAQIVCRVCTKNALITDWFGLAQAGVGK